MSKEFIKVANIQDIPLDTVKVIQAGVHRVALCHSQDGFYAIADLCTHDNGPLGEGEIIDNQIECPRHGARFDIKTGQVTCLPATKPIPTYALEVRGEEIWVAQSPLEYKPEDAKYV